MTENEQAVQKRLKVIRDRVSEIKSCERCDNDTWYLLALIVRYQIGLHYYSNGHHKPKCWCVDRPYLVEQNHTCEIKYQDIEGGKIATEALDYLPKEGE